MSGSQIVFLFYLGQIIVDEPGNLQSFLPPFWAVVFMNNASDILSSPLDSTTLLASARYNASRMGWRVLPGWLGIRCMWVPDRPGEEREGRKGDVPRWDRQLCSVGAPSSS